MKWGPLERYCKRHGYTIVSRGGDTVIQAPRDGNQQRTRQQIYIGHTSCSGHGCELLPCYVSKLRNVFGITEEAVKEG